MAWNGSNGAAKPQKNAGQTKPSVWRGLIAAIIVLGGAAGAYYFFFGPATVGGQRVNANDKVTKIADATPDIAPVMQEAPVEPPQDNIRRTAKGTPIPDKVQPDERGIMRYPNGQRWVDPHDLHIVEHPKPRKLFKRTCDNQIAIILTLDPSKMAPHLIGRRHPYGDDFIKDFHDSLYDTYEDNPDDTAEEAEIRRAVMDTREELKAAMDRGEDIAKLMNATQDELDRLCQYQATLKQELREIEYDEDVSDEDFEDYVKAANRMLEKQGLTGLTMPNIATRQAKLIKLRELLERKTKEASK